MQHGFILNCHPRQQWTVQNAECTHKAFEHSKKIVTSRINPSWITNLQLSPSSNSFIQLHVPSSQNFKLGYEICTRNVRHFPDRITKLPYSRYDTISKRHYTNPTTPYLHTPRHSSMRSRRSPVRRICSLPLPQRLLIRRRTWSSSRHY